MTPRQRVGARKSYAERRAQRADITDPQVVVDAGLRFLEARQRSASEVRRRLADAGYREELVAAAIERLGKLGFLDDEVFARSWVESRDRARPRGERALRSELLGKGIDRAVVDEALAARREDAAAEGSPDEAAAARLLVRHGRALERIADPRTRRRRAYELLSRNGFDPDVAGRAAAAIVSGED